MSWFRLVVCGHSPRNVLEDCFEGLDVRVFNLFHLHRLADGGLQAQLQLGLGCAVQLLVDRRVVTVEGDVSTGGIGEAVKADVLLRRNGKQKTKLQISSQPDVIRCYLVGGWLDERLG